MIFATATELAEEVGQTLPEGDVLARWQAVLTQATDLIRSERGQTLSYKVGDSVEFGDTSQTTLWLPDTPVVSITSVTVNAVALSASAYLFTTFGALWLASGAAWSSGATVVYDHGYRTTDPEFGALRSITLRMASRALFPQELMQGFSTVESAGYAPHVFLTDAERAELVGIGSVAVG